jgi:hypothetical protein
LTGPNRKVDAEIALTRCPHCGHLVSSIMRADAASYLHSAMTDGTPGRAPNVLTEYERRRLGLMLRGLDGWLAGCSYREIAKAPVRSELRSGRT